MSVRASSANHVQCDLDQALWEAWLKVQGRVLDNEIELPSIAANAVGTMDSHDVVCAIDGSLPSLETLSEGWVEALGNALVDLPMLTGMAAANTHATATPRIAHDPEEEHDLAGDPALVHGEHRRAPRAPLVQSDTLLPPAARPQ